MRKWKNTPKEKQRAKDRYLIKKKAIHIIKNMLVHMSGNSCQKCGYNKHNRCLVFHHRDSKTKSFTLDVATIMKKPIEKILEEHEKCDLLCHNCHATHHTIERNNCKSTYLRKQKRWQTKKLEALKDRNNECEKCKFKFHINNIQCATFHHLSDKKFELNCLAFLRKKDYEIKSELIKCQLLCMNCHMELPHD